MAWLGERYKPALIRDFITLTTAALALPLGWGVFSGLLIWTSPFIMLNSVLVLKSFVFLNLAGISVLIISVFRERFFCKYLCPSGCLQDRIAASAPPRNRTRVKLPRLGAWLALLSLAGAIAGFPFFLLLDPVSVFHSFFSFFTASLTLPLAISLSGLPLLLLLSYFFPNLWCAKLCPLGGLQDLMSDAGKQGAAILKRQYAANSDYSPARRFFLLAGLGLAAGFVSKKITAQNIRDHIRPPAAAEANSFNLLCIRCANCIKSCPTGILKQHADPGDLLSWMTPEVIYENGYCLETCNNCSRVCPSGSITLFSPDAKKNIFMGYAEVNYHGCLLSRNKECDRCVASCKYDAISIEQVSGSLNAAPRVYNKLCVGCGACVVICPVRAITVLTGIKV